MKVKGFVLLSALAMLLLAGAQTAGAWCNPGIVYCGTAIDSNTTQGHDDVSRFNCTGSARFYGNAHVYRISHTGGPLWISLDWAGDAEADSALHLFVLESCNRNDCVAHDARYIEGDFAEGDWWIIVEGRSNAADGTPYTLRVFCGDFPFSVELLSFTGVSIDDGVALSWATASETENDRFEIDRKPTGTSNWTTIASVQGMGTSPNGRTYTFLDHTVSAGTWDYRLWAIDLSGNREEVGLVISAVSMFGG